MTTAAPMKPKNIIEDLQSSDPKLQSKAIKNISILEKEISPEKFRKEFFPFLISCINVEEEDVLKDLCSASKDLLRLLGGKKYLKELFPLVELLLHTGEPSVRDEVIKSFRQFIDKQNDFSDIEKELFEVVQKLGSSDDHQHELGFIAFSAEFFGEFKEKYRNFIYNTFKQYTEKKSQGKIICIELAANMKKLIEFLSLKDFNELFNILLKEKCDTVRVKLVEIFYGLEKVKNLSEYDNFVINAINSFASDESWRVRFMLVKLLPEVLNLLNQFQNNKELKTCILKNYYKLIQDKEGEVRSMSCKILENVTENLNKEENFDKVLSYLKNIKSDNLAYVRKSLAQTLLSIAPKIGESKTKEYVLPIFHELIKDEDHDIRMVLIKNLDKLNEVINIDNFVQGILPSLDEISENKNWRTRNQIEETIIVFARITNRKIFFDNIMPICIKRLTDPVYAIRRKSCKMMKKLYDMLRGEDFEKKLLSKLNSMTKSDSYLIRLTVVFLIKEFLIDEYDLEFLEKRLFPYLCKLSGDKIANVRQECSVAIKKLVRLSKNKDVVKECKSLIDELKRDKDIEVVYAITDN